MKLQRSAIAYSMRILALAIALTLNHLCPSLTTHHTSGLFSVLHLNQSWHLLFPLPEFIILLLFPQPGHSHLLGVCSSDTSSERLSLTHLSTYPPYVIIVI